MYVAYDLKGVQAQVFSVPKLKAICGASSLLAQFDASAEPWAAACHATRIFAGGGRGAFHCDDPADRESLINQLKLAAREHGFDLRIGVDRSLSNACHHADQLYPFNPDSLDGAPCRLSGRWPVTKSPSRGAFRGVHPIIAARLKAGRTDQLGANLLSDLSDRADLPDVLRAFDCRFFRNINAPSAQGDPIEDDDEVAWEQNDAQAAANAIGRRSRWAVVCLDGNDIGKQFLAFHKLKKQGQAADANELSWLRAMSSALSQATRHAFLDALVHVLQLWIKDYGGQAPLDCTYLDDQEPSGKHTLVLPLRPLIIGGDDVTLLIHPAYAMSFVRVMTKRFTERSADLASDYGATSKAQLWPATSGKLTMSAGVLYCKTTFPLNMAIEFAESLLKNAKAGFRDRPVVAGGPTPAAVDWESITETLVESPSERRQRELEFIDPELPLAPTTTAADSADSADASQGCKVVLYGRPYAIEPHPQAMDIAQIDSLANRLAPVPTSVRAQVLPRLKRPWSERIAFLASVAKRHPLLKQLLWEGTQSLGSGWKEAPAHHTRITHVPDALLLLEEEKRLLQVASIAGWASQSDSAPHSDSAPQSDSAQSAG